MPETSGHFAVFASMGERLRRRWRIAGAKAAEHRHASKEIVMMMNTLNAGEKLLPGQMLTSTNRRYTLVYEVDGNLVLYDRNTAVWSSNTGGRTAGEAVMQNDGHVCLYAAGGQFYWGTGVHGFGGGRLILQDDRNLVVYRSDSSAAWVSGTDVRSTLSAGERLTPGQRLVSANGRYELAYEADGDLALYDGATQVWTSNTGGRSGGEAVMQSDGHFCLYTSGGEFYWGTGAHGFSDGRLTLQDDRNLVVYRSDNSAAWVSGTYVISRLNAGERLTPGQRLVSMNGHYELVYEADGDLALYDGATRIWASNTGGGTGGEAVMQDDGHFCLYTSGGEFYWGTGAHGFSNGHLVLQDDRNLVVYRSDNAAAWTSGSHVVDRAAPVSIGWLTGDQPQLLSMMAACPKVREGLSGDWWEGFADDDVRTHAQAVGQYHSIVYVAFSELSGSGQLWIYNTANGHNSLRSDVLPAAHPHPCSIQIVGRYMIVAVESAYPPSQDPRPEFSAIAIYDLEPDPMQPREIARIDQGDCNCGGAGLAFHPQTQRWFILADQDKRSGGGTRLYRSASDAITSFSATPLRVYNQRFGTGAGNDLITASDGSIWALYYEDTTEHLPSHMSWNMTADVVRLWKLIEPDGTPVASFDAKRQYTDIGSPQLGNAGVLLNNRPGMRFGASLRNENGRIELMTCQRNMRSTFNISRSHLLPGRSAVMLVNFGSFESEIYCTVGGQTQHSGHLPVSQSWGTTMVADSIHGNINHNAGFTWVDDWDGDTTAPLTLFVTKGLTQSARVQIHSFTTGYNGGTEVDGHSPDGAEKLDPRNW